MYDDDGSDEPSDNSMHTEDIKTYQDKKITQVVFRLGFNFCDIIFPFVKLVGKSLVRIYTQGKDDRN